MPGPRSPASLATSRSAPVICPSRSSEPSRRSTSRRGSTQRKPTWRASRASNVRRARCSSCPRVCSIIWPEAHAGRAGALAVAAQEAEVHLLGEVGAGLQARLRHRGHQVHAPARARRLGAGEPEGGAALQAQTAVDAVQALRVVDQLGRVHHSSPAKRRSGSRAARRALHQLEPGRSARLELGAGGSARQRSRAGRPARARCRATAPSASSGCTSSSAWATPGWAWVRRVRPSSAAAAAARSRAGARALRRQGQLERRPAAVGAAPSRAAARWRGLGHRPAPARPAEAPGPARARARRSRAGPQGQLQAPGAALVGPIVRPERHGLPGAASTSRARARAASRSAQSAAARAHPRGPGRAARRRRAPRTACRGSRSTAVQVVAGDVLHQLAAAARQGAVRQQHAHAQGASCAPGRRAGGRSRSVRRPARRPRVARPGWGTSGVRWWPPAATADASSARVVPARAPTSRRRARRR